MPPPATRGGRRGCVAPAASPCAPARSRRRSGVASSRSSSRTSTRTTSSSIGRSPDRSPTWPRCATTDRSAGEHYLAAGIPWFATLFGRDSIIAALETVAFIPRFAIATLDVLARLQATTDDPWHDAEPGKILHEMRTGEMARAGETPHDAYYGSVDSTPLWLILLGEAHAWTGDDALLERLWPNALAALAWIDESGDLDGDGFVEYRRRSRARSAQPGLEGFGRRDPSHRRPAGRVGPIALAEVQGYVYAAKRAMARLARHRGDDGAGGPARHRRRRPA